MRSFSLLDLGAVRCSRDPCRRSARSLIEAEPEAAFDIAAETEEPFAADRDVVELADVDAPRLD